MHASVLAWIRTALTAGEVAGRDVLEVGSADVNGSVRPWIESLEPASYLGVDASPGPRVDRVLPCDQLVAVLGSDCADVVVSTEMLEHVADWRSCVWNLVHAVRPGGLLVVTTRSEGFPYHGYPDDHWRYSLDVMRRILGRGGLEVLDLVDDPQPRHPGVFAKARKPSSWSPVDASVWAGIPVISMLRSGNTMKQATQSGWYVNTAGTEVFVKQGTVRPDNHPDVAALPSAFEDLDIDEGSKPAAKTRKS